MHSLSGLQRRTGEYDEGHADIAGIRCENGSGNFRSGRLTGNTGEYAAVAKQKRLGVSRALPIVQDVFSES